MWHRARGDSARSAAGRADEGANQEPVPLIAALQRYAGNRAVQRMLDSATRPVGAAPDAAAAFALATSGTAGPVPMRAEMERAFGADFGGVRAHLGGAPARDGLAMLGASAATHGSDVVFRDASPSRQLVAHELTHVVQQSGGTAAPTGVSSPGDAAERAAEAVGGAVARGETAPEVGGATSEIHRAVATAGGVWDTASYSTVSSPGVVGATIDVTFTPKDPVVADNIGLTQSVTTLRSTSAGGAVDDPSFVSDRNKDLSLPAGSRDRGRAIDQGDGSTVPNTNPLYAVENAPGSISATLGDVAPSAGFGTHASRKQRPDGTFVETAGNLKDTPRRGIEFPGQEWRQAFETTAIALDGPLANMYMGSVEWGWRSDAKGKVTLDPTALRVVRMGPPSAAFTDAARLWNSTTFTDTATGTAYNTVDLPLSEQTVVVPMPFGLPPLQFNVTDDPGGLPTVDLALRLAGLKTELAGLADGPDKVRKNFLKLAYDRELGRRNVKVAVKVKSTEDWLGADHVYCRLAGSKVHVTPTKKLNDGDSFDFLVPLSAFATDLPLTQQVKIEVFDEDWPDADDKLVSMTWDPPYAPLQNSATMDDADYDVHVSFER
ncbi:eCIS core domain-containing protein [Phytohabitans aurantiacus]|uniref:eCIS core domain-containing protein n=1 Tax=Phytohabitans aurantiacus TaxID=3016789 RepID=A0ABQ5R1R5_9ACTN|nr:DUF4157 domain-containing protein [Phytohabitans aurantiacus]GLI00739.1 hypothetical protein Pa4123_60150 [Phytohabitans aurantiacus]